VSAQRVLLAHARAAGVGAASFLCTPADTQPTLWPPFCAGILQLSLGERATLTCTADVAYGERGMPPRIPPHSTLCFDVQLLKIGGPGSGQTPTMWNTPVAAFLLVLLTSVIAWGLHDSFTNHNFLEHFGFK
jgi:FKBP-type peptidyl-prolyl cis-trans isomerase